MECTLSELCAQVGALSHDIDSLWSATFGGEEPVYIFTGNTGIPAYQDSLSNTVRYSKDLTEYMQGSTLITSFDPKGVFLLGNANFDISERLLGGTYNLDLQENKVYSGFGLLVNRVKLWPVMSKYDFWIAHDRVLGTVPERMGDTYLRGFPYLPDAKRYYSVYDPKSKTEFFVLSDGRYENYADATQTGSIYPLDTLVGGDQYNWFTNRLSSTPATIKVVVFAHPYTNITNVLNGVENKGPVTVNPAFADWDFQDLGINLIINGAVGASYHLRKSSTHIVNSSAFSRSRMGLIKVANGDNPPEVTTLYGEGGFAIEYVSGHPVGTVVDNVTLPNPANSYVIPKNEFLRIRCTADALYGEFVSYNPYAGSQTLVRASMVVEHSFTVEA